MKQVRRGLRAIRYFWHRLRSYLVLTWYKSLYANLSIGRGVIVDRAVNLAVSNDGFLRIGDGVRIEANCHLLAKGRLTIGARTFIGAGSMIVASEAIDIGADALIAAYVTIRDQDHGFADRGRPYSTQPLETSPIVIGDNVWLGSGAVVCPGVTIGEDTVVGAGGVVTRDLPAGVVALGVPARVQREIGEADRVDFPRD